MRILRLSHSGDAFPGVPEGSHSWEITARVVAAALGEPVETTSRVIWPAPELPDLVDSWLTRYDPHVVVLWVNAYWFTFLNLPEARRTSWPIVKAAGRLAARAHLKKPLVYRFGKLRRQALVWRRAGREFFEPEEIIVLCGEIIRRVLQHEDVSLVVRLDGPSPAIMNEALLARAEARRLVLHRALGPLCEQLHVPYLGLEDGIAYVRAGYLHEDGLHSNEKDHARMATEETAAILDAWRPAHRT